MVQRPCTATLIKALRVRARTLAWGPSLLSLLCLSGKDLDIPYNPLQSTCWIHGTQATSATSQVCLWLPLCIIFPAWRLSSPWVVSLYLSSQGLVEVSRWGWAGAIRLMLAWGKGREGVSDQVEREERMEGRLPRRRRFKWLKFLMQLSGRYAMRKVTEKPIGSWAKKLRSQNLSHGLWSSSGRSPDSECRRWAPAGSLSPGDTWTHAKHFTSQNYQMKWLHWKRGQIKEEEET